MKEANFSKKNTSYSKIRKSDTNNTILISETLMNSIPDMCVIISERGIITEANERAKIFFNLKSDLTDYTFHHFLKKDFQNSFVQKVGECINNNSDIKIESEIQINSNNTLNVELFLHPITINSDNRQRHCFVVIRDISNQKKKELDLLRFTKLAHFTANPIEITDSNGNIIFVNPAFEQASGYRKEELIGKNPNVFGSRKQSKIFWQKMWQTISSGKVWVGEVENKKRSGEPFYTQLLISPIMSEEGKIVGYFGIHRDISDQKNLEQQLMHAQKMESIGMLAAGLAHEVGNPLASISSLVQILQRTSDDEFIQEKLELIKSQITRISRIIRDLVDFSRKSNYEMQLTDVNKVIRDALEIIKVSKKAKDIEIEISLDNTLPPLMLVPDQIEQVFINLLLNAVDALYDQPITQIKQYGKTNKLIKIQSEIQDNNLIVTVEDNGKGIKQEDISKIFEPFFTTKNVGEGTGLGLWVSYGIIKSFRGEIRVKSVEGYGTIFTVKLPLQFS